MAERIEADRLRQRREIIFGEDIEKAQSDLVKAREISIPDDDWE